MQRRQLIQIAAATCAGIAAPRVFAAGEKLVPLKFTLDFRISGQVAPFLLALAKGYYREQGLAVTIDVGNGSVASITRVASGASRSSAMKAASATAARGVREGRRTSGSCQAVRSAASWKAA